MTELQEILGFDYDYFSFNDYQELAEGTAVYPNKGNNLVYTVLGLASEAGEVAGKLKKVIRDDDNVISDGRKLQIMDELSDVLWYLAATASELELSLQDIAKHNLEKLYSRKERSVLQGSGDDR